MLSASLSLRQASGPSSFHLTEKIQEHRRLKKIFCFHRHVLAQWRRVFLSSSLTSSSAFRRMFPPESFTLSPPPPPSSLSSSVLFPSARSAEGGEEEYRDEEMMMRREVEEEVEQRMREGGRSNSSCLSSSVSQSPPKSFGDMDVPVPPALFPFIQTRCIHPGGRHAAASSSTSSPLLFPPHRRLQQVGRRLSMFPSRYSLTDRERNEAEGEGGGNSSASSTTTDIDNGNNNHNNKDSFHPSSSPVFASRVQWLLRANSVLLLPSATGRTANEASWNALLASLQMCRGDPNYWNYLLHSVVNRKDFLSLEALMNEWVKKGRERPQHLPSMFSGEVEEGKEGEKENRKVNGNNLSHHKSAGSSNSSSSSSSKRGRSSLSSSSPGSVLSPLLFSIDTLPTTARGDVDVGSCRLRHGGRREGVRGGAVEEAQGWGTGGRGDDKRGRDDHGAVVAGNGVDTSSPFGGFSLPLSFLFPNTTFSTSSSSSTSFFPSFLHGLNRNHYYITLSVFTKASSSLSLPPSPSPSLSSSSSSFSIPPPTWSSTRTAGRWKEAPHELSSSAEVEAGGEGSGNDDVIGEINLGRSGGRGEGKGGGLTILNGLRHVIRMGVCTLTSMVEDQRRENEERERERRIKMERKTNYPVDNGEPLQRQQHPQQVEREAMREKREGEMEDARIVLSSSHKSTIPPSSLPEQQKQEPPSSSSSAPPLLPQSDCIPLSSLISPTSTIPTPTHCAEAPIFSIPSSKHRQDEFDVPDVGVMWRTMEAITQCEVELTCQQEAMHKPALRLGQLLAGFPGDVEIFTKVTARIRSTTTHNNLNGGGHSIFAGLRYTAESPSWASRSTWWSGFTLEEPDYLLSAEEKERKARFSGKNVSSSFSYSSSSSRLRIKRYMSNMLDAIHAGRWRGPLLLIIEAITGLYEQVCLCHAGVDVGGAGVPPFLLSIKDDSRMRMTRHPTNTEMRRGSEMDVDRRMQDSRRVSLTGRGGGRSKPFILTTTSPTFSTASRTGWTSVEGVSFPVLSLRHPNTREGIDFLVFSWFGSPPQLRSFSIQPHRDREQYLYKGQRYDSMNRAMLFYDILGCRLLFAESHHWELTTAVRRVHALAVMLNMPREDCHPRYSFPPRWIPAPSSSSSSSMQSMPNSSFGGNMRRRNQGEKEMEQRKGEEEKERRPIGATVESHRPPRATPTPTPAMSSSLAVLQDSLVTRHQRKCLQMEYPVLQWAFDGKNPQILRFSPDYYDQHYHRHSSSSSPSSSFSSSFRSHAEKSRTDGGIIPLPVTCSSSSPSSSSSSLLSVPITHSPFHSMKDFAFGVGRQEALVRLVQQAVWGGGLRSTGCGDDEKRQEEEKRENRTMMTSPSGNSSSSYPSSPSHSTFHNNTNNNHQNHAAFTRKKREGEVRRAQRRALRYLLRRQPSQLIALMSVLEGLGRFSFRFVPEDENSERGEANLEDEGEERRGGHGGGGLSGVAELLFQLQRPIVPQRPSSTTTTTTTTTSSPICSSLFSCRHHTSIGAPPTIAASSSSFSATSTWRIAPVSFSSPLQAAVREGEGVNPQQEKSQLRRNRRRMVPQGILPALTWLCQRTLESIYETFPSLSVQLLPLDMLLQTAVQADPFLPPLSSSRRHHDCFPPYSSIFYSPPSLLGHLLHGICGKYECRYELVPRSPPEKPLHRSRVQPQQKQRGMHGIDCLTSDGRGKGEEVPVAKRILHDHSHHKKSKDEKKHFSSFVTASSSSAMFATSLESRKTHVDSKKWSEHSDDADAEEDGFAAVQDHPRSSSSSPYPSSSLLLLEDDPVTHEEAEDGEEAVVVRRGWYRSSSSAAAASLSSALFPSRLRRVRHNTRDDDSIQEWGDAHGRRGEEEETASLIMGESSTSITYARTPPPIFYAHLHPPALTASITAGHHHRHHHHVGECENERGSGERSGAPSLFCAPSTNPSSCASPTPNMDWRDVTASFSSSPSSQGLKFSTTTPLPTLPIMEYVCYLTVPFIWCRRYMNVPHPTSPISFTPSPPSPPLVSRKKRRGRVRSSGASLDAGEGGEENGEDTVQEDNLEGEGEGVGSHGRAATVVGNSGGGGGGATPFLLGIGYGSSKRDAWRAAAAQALALNFSDVWKYQLPLWRRICDALLFSPPALNRLYWQHQHQQHSHGNAPLRPLLPRNNTKNKNNNHRLVSERQQSKDSPCSGEGKRTSITSSGDVEEKKKENVPSTIGGRMMMPDTRNKDNQQQVNGKEGREKNKDQSTYNNDYSSSSSSASSTPPSTTTTAMAAYGLSFECYPPCVSSASSSSTLPSSISRLLSPHFFSCIATPDLCPTFLSSSSPPPPRHDEYPANNPYRFLRNPNWNSSTNNKNKNKRRRESTHRNNKNITPILGVGYGVTPGEAFASLATQLVQRAAAAAPSPTPLSCLISSEIPQPPPTATSTTMAVAEAAAPRGKAEAPTTEMNTEGVPPKKEEQEKEKRVEVAGKEGSISTPPTKTPIPAGEDESGRREEEKEGDGESPSAVVASSSFCGSSSSPLPSPPSPSPLPPPPPCHHHYYSLSSSDAAPSLFLLTFGHWGASSHCTKSIIHSHCEYVRLCYAAVMYPPSRWWQGTQHQHAPPTTPTSSSSSSVFVSSTGKWWEWAPFSSTSSERGGRFELLYVQQRTLQSPSSTFRTLLKQAMEVKPKLEVKEEEEEEGVESMVGVGKKHQPAEKEGSSGNESRKKADCSSTSPTREANHTSTARRMNTNENRKNTTRTEARVEDEGRERDGLVLVLVHRSWYKRDEKYSRITSRCVHDPCSNTATNHNKNNAGGGGAAISSSTLPPPPVTVVEKGGKPDGFRDAPLDEMRCADGGRQEGGKEHYHSLPPLPPSFQWSEGKIGVRRKPLAKIRLPPLAFILPSSPTSSCSITTKSEGGGNMETGEEEEGRRGGPPPASRAAAGGRHTLPQGHISPAEEPRRADDAIFAGVRVRTRLSAWWKVICHTLNTFEDALKELEENETEEEGEHKRNKGAAQGEKTSWGASSFSSDLLYPQWRTFQSSFSQRLHHIRYCYRLRPLHRCQEMISLIFGVPVRIVGSPVYADASPISTPISTTTTSFPPSSSSAVFMDDMEKTEKEGLEGRATKDPLPPPQEEKNEEDKGKRGSGGGLSSASTSAFLFGLPPSPSAWRLTLFARVPLLPSPFPDPTAPSSLWWVVCIAESNVGQGEWGAPSPSLFSLSSQPSSSSHHHRHRGCPLPLPPPYRTIATRGRTPHSAAAPAPGCNSDRPRPRPRRGGGQEGVGGKSAVEEALVRIVEDFVDYEVLPSLALPCSSTSRHFSSFTSEG